MPLLFVRNDITKMNVDAIVNAAKTSLLGGGGVDGSIHRAAGKGLLQECRTLGGCDVGDAKKTGAYNLPCKYVIHTVGPVWKDGFSGEAALLRSCYQRSMEIADECGCETLAFPLISTGTYKYPKDQAMAIAVDTIKNFLEEHEMTIYLVVFDQKSLQSVPENYGAVEQFISDHYVDEAKLLDRQRYRYGNSVSSRINLNAPLENYSGSAEPVIFAETPIKAESKDSLNDYLDSLDESFSQMLLRKIDEKNISDVQCYKKANIDRKHFAKIRKDPSYRPKKTTVIAFAIALELSLDETKEMLMKAGYALSRSNKFDVIIEYYLVNHIYDIFVINNKLFEHDQVLLGA